MLDLHQIILAGPATERPARSMPTQPAEQLQTSTFAREVHTTAVSLSTMGADPAALGRPAWFSIAI